MGGLSKKQTELTDMDNSVVIAGGRGSVRGLNGNGKNLRKIKFKKFLKDNHLWYAFGQFPDH